MSGSPISAVVHRFRPRAGERDYIEQPGAALYVQSGAQGGLRVFFDAETERWTGEHSFPLVDCAVIPRAWKKAVIQWPELVDEDRALVVVAYDCAGLAVDPTGGCTPRTRTRYLWRDQGPVTIAEDTETDLVASTFCPIVERGGSDRAEIFSSVDSYIGGALRADDVFTITLYHVITFEDASTQEIPVLRWVAAEFPAASGAFGTSLEFGGTRTFAAGLTQGLAPAPKPGFRITITPAVGAGVENLRGVIYTRSLL